MFSEGRCQWPLPADTSENCLHPDFLLQLLILGLKHLFCITSENANCHVVFAINSSCVLASDGSVDVVYVGDHFVWTIGGKQWEVQLTGGRSGLIGGCRMLV